MTRRVIGFVPLVLQGHQFGGHQPNSGDTNQFGGHDTNQFGETNSGDTIQFGGHQTPYNSGDTILNSVFA